MSADEGEMAELPFHSADRREVNSPEIEVLVEEGDAVGVRAVLLAELADDVDIGFLVALRPAEDKLLLGGKLMAGEEAGAVKAEQDRGGGIGKDFAVQVAPDEEDGDFFRDAARAAHNLWWQERGQREWRGETI